MRLLLIVPQSGNLWDYSKCVLDYVKPMPNYKWRSGSCTSFKWMLSLCFERKTVLLMLFSLKEPGSRQISNFCKMGAVHQSHEYVSVPLEERLQKTWKIIFAASFVYVCHVLSAMCCKMVIPREKFLFLFGSRKNTQLKKLQPKLLFRKRRYGVLPPKP